MTIDLTRIKVVSFDVGGTLLHPWPSVGAIYAECMADHGLHLPAAKLEAAFKQAWLDYSRSRVHDRTSSEKDWWYMLVKSVVVDLGELDDFDEMFDDLWHRFASPDYWRVFNGVEETLAACRERDWRLYVLSNWDERLRILLEAMPLHDYFDHLIISAEAGVEKPDRRIFELLEYHADVKGDAILHIGDSHYHDIAGAGALGWQTKLVKGHKVDDQHHMDFGLFSDD